MAEAQWLGPTGDVEALFGPDRQAGRWLRQARQGAGLSLRALAARAGTSHSTLVAYEQGRKVPAVTVFLRLLEACNLAVELRLRPRVRWRGTLPRGEELAQALELAEQFPSRYARSRPALEFPRFGSCEDDAAP